MGQLLATFNFEIKLAMKFKFNVTFFNAIFISIKYLKRPLGHSLLKRLSFTLAD